MKKLSLTISFAGMLDETAALCEFVCPDHHYLEAWNDYNPRSSHFSLQQPAIRPLFSTRHAQESLLSWSLNKVDFHSYIQKYWQEKLFTTQAVDFTSFWNSTLRDGVITIAPSVIPVAKGPVSNVNVVSTITDDGISFRVELFHSMKQRNKLLPLKEENMSFPFILKLQLVMVLNLKTHGCKRCPIQ